MLLYYILTKQSGTDNWLKRIRNGKFRWRTKVDRKRIPEGTSEEKIVAKHCVRWRIFKTICRAGAIGLGRNPLTSEDHYYPWARGCGLGHVGPFHAAISYANRTSQGTSFNAKLILQRAYYIPPRPAIVITWSAVNFAANSKQQLIRQVQDRYGANELRVTSFSSKLNGSSVYSGHSHCLRELPTI